MCECHGEGEIIESPCNKCHGTGSTRKVKTIEVDIPAGIDDGQMIKLSGQGEIGSKGGPRGDLYIVVNVKKHSLFTREGYDVYLEMPSIIQSGCFRWRNRSAYIRWKGII